MAWRNGNLQSPERYMGVTRAGLISPMSCVSHLNREFRINLDSFSKPTSHEDEAPFSFLKCEAKRPLKQTLGTKNWLREYHQRQRLALSLLDSVWDWWSLSTRVIVIKNYWNECAMMPE